jgi:putative nucleotidyltransferase-like protein
MHGVSSLLYRAARWPDAPGWMEFLAEQRPHTANRHVRILDLLERLDESTGRRGIPAMALKGAALHALGLYSAGDRPMADVDLLVRRPGTLSVPPG